MSRNGTRVCTIAKATRKGSSGGSIPQYLSLMREKGSLEWPAIEAILVEL